MAINNSNNDQDRDRQHSNRIKDPEDWKTGDEPMTGAQESYLETLSTEAGEEPAKDLTKAEAAKKREELQNKTGRGMDNSSNREQSGRE
jgi:hypothetical protein